MQGRKLKPGELPPPPEGVDKTKWLNTLLALKAEGGMPDSELQRITNLRQANLYVWMVIILKNPWRLIRENESILIAKDFKTPDTSDDWKLKKEAQK